MQVQTLESRSPALQNWARNVTYRASAVHRPATVDELRELVAATPRIRALGSRHSFSEVADTEGALVRLDALPPVIELTGDSVTVAAGLRYSDIVGSLDVQGKALANLASLPHISVAGSVATGTHGSGNTLGSLAAAVRAVTIVDPAGELVVLRRGYHPRFEGAVVALGALGIVAAVELDLVDSFEVAQEVRVGVPLDQVEREWDAIFGAAYSVSVFTTYATGPANIFLKRRVGDDPPSWTGGRSTTALVHPIEGLDTGAVTMQLRLAGPWQERLPHFRADFVPSVGEELQSEFLVPRANGPAGVAALRAIGPNLAAALHTAEIRTVAADELWLSPAFGRDSAAFHFTWKPDLDAVLPVLKRVEAALWPLDARPHWGKLCTVPPAEVIARYPRAGDFATLRSTLDPAGKFGNPYVQSLFPDA